MSKTFKLKLFGPPQAVDLDGQDIRTALGGPKRFAILAYVAAAHGGRPVRRDTLLSVFWPDLDQERGRRALRQALHGIRSAVGDRVLNGKSDEEVGIDSALLWCDTAAFESAVSSNEMVTAVEHYTGPFFEGFHLSGTAEFEDWVDRQRRRYQDTATEIAWKLSDFAESESDIISAAHWARTAMAISPEDESTLQRLVAALDRFGDRAGALRAYERFAAKLKTEFETTPSPETVALIDEVRARRTPNGTTSGNGGTRQEKGNGRSHAAVVPPNNQPTIHSTEPRDVARHPLRDTWPWKRSVGIFTLLAAAAAIAFVVFRGPGPEAVPRILVTVPDVLGQPPHADFNLVAAEWVIAGLTDAGHSPVIQISTAVSRYAPTLDPAGAGWYDPGVISRLGVEARARFVVTPRISFIDSNGVITGQIHDLRENEIHPLPFIDLDRDQPMTGINRFRAAVLTDFGTRIDPSFLTAAGTTTRVPTFEGVRLVVRGKRTFFSDSAITFFRQSASTDPDILTPRAWAAFRHWAGNESSELDSTLASIAQWNHSSGRTDSLLRQLATLGANNDFEAEHIRIRALARAFADDEWMIGTYISNALRRGRPEEAHVALTDLLPPYANPHIRALDHATILHNLDRYEDEHRVIRTVLDAVDSGAVVRPDIVSRLRYLEVRSLAALGRADEAVARARARSDALAFSGFRAAATYTEAADFLGIHGHASAARVLYEQALEIVENSPAPRGPPWLQHELLAGIYEGLEQWDHAREAAREWLLAYPSSVLAFATLGRVAAATGDVSTAEQMIDSIATGEFYGHESVSYVQQATITAALGRTADTGRLLGEAFARGHPRNNMHELEHMFGALDQYSPVRLAGF